MSEKPQPHSKDMPHHKAHAAVDKHVRPKVKAWQEPPEAPPALLTVTIENDNLIPHGIDYKYSDGGIFTSQLSAHYSHGIAKGWLKDGSVTGGLGVVTSTGWGGNNNEAAFHGKDVEDNYQAPGGENYHLTGAINKPLILGAHTLDAGLRTDLGVASGNKLVQNAWHGATTSYYRSQIDKIATKALVNVEATGAYHLLARDPSRPLIDAALLGGVSLGNGYHGAMAGAEFSIGSASAHAMGVTTHSAQFGNTSITHVGSGKDQGNGWKVSVFGKVYASGTQDYRTTTDASNPITHGYVKDITVTPQSFDLSAPLLFRAKAPNGDIVSQYPLLSATPTTLHFDMPAPIANYHFNAGNAEAGLKAQVKLARVTLGAQVSVATNPLRAQVNENYLTALKLEENYKYVATDKTTIMVPFTDAKTGKTAYQPYAYGVLLFPDENNAQHQGDAPHVTWQGEVSVQIALGGGKKSSSKNR